MPLTRELLAAYIADNGPWAYHTTSPYNIDSIEEEGIVYHEDRLDTGDAGSREGHSYLYVGAARNFAPFRIDLRKLDPEHFMLDTDAATVMEDWKEQWEAGEAAVYYIKELFDDHPHWDKPENVMKGMREHHTFAYTAPIPPHAIERNHLYWDSPGNVKRYEEAVGREQEQLEQNERFEREYMERQELVKDLPEQQKHEGWAWTEDGDVYTKSGDSYMQTQFVDKDVIAIMASRGVLPRDEYEMRRKMEEVVKEHGGDSSLLYSPSTDVYGKAYLQQKMRLGHFQESEPESIERPELGL